MRRKTANFLKKVISVWILVFMISGTFSYSEVYADTKVITRGNTDKPYISLTFDDGGSVKNVNSVLETLDKYDVKASFFFLGSFIDSNPNLMKTIADKGHDVGNHSYSHPDFTKSSYKKIINELLKSEEAFKIATGYDMKSYVRPPYGAKNNSVLNAISDAGYAYTVLWNIDTNDWKKKSADELVNHVLKNASNGSIVLMHTTASSNSAKALAKMIEGLQNKGYKLVSLSEMLGEISDDISKLTGDEISEVEFLNNILYSKTGSFYGTAEEIQNTAEEFKLIEKSPKISFNKAYTKEEMITLIKKLYPLRTDIDTKFENFEFKKSNLQQMIQMLSN